jgi:hypothetical protein
VDFIFERSRRIVISKIDQSASSIVVFVDVFDLRGKNTRLGGTSLRKKRIIPRCLVRERFVDFRVFSCSSSRDALTVRKYSLASLLGFV